MDSKKRSIELKHQRIIRLRESSDSHADVCSKSPKKFQRCRIINRKLISFLDEQSDDEDGEEAPLGNTCRKSRKRRRYLILSSDEQSDDEDGEEVPLGNTCRKSRKRRRYLILSSDEQSDDEDGKGTPQRSTYRKSRRRRRYLKSRLRDKNRKLISSSDEQSDDEGERTSQGSTHHRSRKHRRYSVGRFHSSKKAEYTQARKTIHSETVMDAILSNSSSTDESTSRSSSPFSSTSNEAGDSSFSSDESSDYESSSSNVITDKKSERTAYPGMRKIVQGAFTTRGISKEPAKMMMNSLSDSTLRQYKKPLREWWKYCNKRKISLYEFDSTVILDFLQLQRNNDLKCNGIRLYRAALSFIMEGKPGKDPDISRFVKAVAKVEDIDEKPVLNDNINNY